MPIPEFADHGALPPFISGHATSPSARSPYPATMLEVVERFCTSLDRAKLLKGLNLYRKHLHSGGFVSGTQWVDGSFIENVEANRKRSPRDIDVVTLFSRPLKYQVDPDTWATDFESHIFGAYFDTRNMKLAYRCDTYGVDLDAGPRALVRNSTYWFGLFSDMRGSAEKKGILEIPLAADPMEFLAIDQAIGGKFDV
ncbi:DUF6932 family protein [Hoeflea sp.]|uniref:DUF6932 family protein n=1 Tax=Hoeflea sp. TaxID=1940281 RepID=UPI003A8F576E